MGRVRSRGESVRRFILATLETQPRDVVRITAEHFSISRQAVHKHLKHLVDEQAIVSAGKTSGRVYRLTPLVEWRERFEIASEPQEDLVWRKLAPSLGVLPDNVRKIWAYCFTEMFNNALDHSGGSVVSVYVTKTAASTEIAIADDGVGIFRKIQDALGLVDPRHAVLELAKGKFTTDPARHTGEGIFFTSRSLDAFCILSGEVYYSHNFGRPEDWILEHDKTAEGTYVQMRLHNHTARSLSAIFDEFAGDEYAFTKTVVPVRLTQYGDDNLVSRSQAKRLLLRVDRFRTVILDFDRVESIGQAFADEIFRVFQAQHPEVQLVPVHANPAVSAMISRALVGGSPTQ